MEMVSGSVQKEIEKMRKDEVVKKNISLVFDFLRYLTDHPELLENLSDGCELEFLDRDFPLNEKKTSVEGAEKAFLNVGHTFSLADRYETEENAVILE